MAFLSTVPTGSSNSGLSGSPSLAVKRSEPCTLPARVAASASSNAMAAAGPHTEGNDLQGLILSTEEVKLPACPDEVELLKVSVPRFCRKPVAKKPFSRLHSDADSALAKPPGLHVRPPPGLTRQTEASALWSSQDLCSLRSLTLPPLLAPSAALSSAASTEQVECLAMGQDEEEEQNEAEEVVAKSTSELRSCPAETTAPLQPLLPVLLGSRPQSSLLGSAPLYGKHLAQKRDMSSFQAIVNESQGSSR